MVADASLFLALRSGNRLDGQVTFRQLSYRPARRSCTARHARATRPGTNSGRLSPDGKLVLAKGPEAKYFLYSLSGGEPRSIPWLSDFERLIRWTADGRSVLVSSDASFPSRVERVDLETGRRTLYKEIAPQDRVGLMGVFPSFITNDERSYAYSFARQTSVLFLVESKK